MTSNVKRPKTAAERRARVDQILRGLDKMYPNATCALHHRNPWELLVATILSAQCTDKRVNEVTPGLFAKYPTPRDFAAVRPEVLAQDIHSTGFFNNKAKSIVGAAQKVLRDFGGKVPQTMDEMLVIPGAARKTANVVLGTAYGIAVGSGRGHARAARLAPLDLTKANRSGQNRAGLDEDRPARPLDPFLTPDYPPWPRAVPGAQAALRRVSAGSDLLRERQDYLTHA